MCRIVPGGLEARQSPLVSFSTTNTSRRSDEFSRMMRHASQASPLPGLLLKAFDVEFGQTTKWDGDQLIVISAFWDAARQRQQIGLA
jgi:hypothetical protein